MANRNNRQDVTTAAGQTAMGAAIAGAGVPAGPALPATDTTAAVVHAVDTAAGVQPRNVRIVFSKPWSADGAATRTLRDGEILANAALVNLPLPGMQISGIGVKRMARDRSLAITMPTTANGMIPVVGGRMEKLDKPQYDARMRVVTERMAEESAVAIGQFSDLILDAWAAASKTENPFADTGVAVDL